MLHDTLVVMIRILQILGGLLLVAFIVLLAQNNDHDVDLYLSFFSVTGLYVPTLTMPVWLLVFCTAVLFFGLGIGAFWVFLWQRRTLQPYLKTLASQK